MHPLNVIFCWHMHQPFYREADSGQYHLPWAYLHAIKDYTDIATVLEKNGRAVVNFVPSLTAQLDDYGQHLRAWLDGKEDSSLPDPLLSALAGETNLDNDNIRRLLLSSCFRLNHERNMQRYPEYMRLWNLAQTEQQEQKKAENNVVYSYLSEQYFYDLLVWYHLAWLAESVRRDSFVAKRLFAKASKFNADDRRDLLSLITELITTVSTRYSQLAKRGIIELSTTPYAHPILPLMLDFETARATVHNARIPAIQYPGGEERACDHITTAQVAHEQSFAVKASGCWPAEGGVSEAALALLGKADFTWTATGEGVLHHSLGYNLRESNGGADLYQPWLVGEDEEQIACFFRDDKLSDLIGFEYQRWRTEDAVANLVHELKEIHQRVAHQYAKRPPVVSIIMDGENAWEHFHENALPFLTQLYQALESEAQIKLTTFSEYLETYPATNKLERLVPGSWVYGNFSTWIGDEAKTNAWELLIAAKQVYDKVFLTDKLDSAQQEAATQQLRICEGSDWCWWFGDYNPSDVVRDFDALYRAHLRKLYHLLQKNTPDNLTASLAKGCTNNAENTGTMRRGNS
ncbi:MAG: glycoside hydrolase family 57 protein [Mariprofundales bacterium]